MKARSLLISSSPTTTRPVFSWPFGQTYVSELVFQPPARPGQSVVGGPTYPYSCAGLAPKS